MRITPASPAPGASTVFVCTMWSYCCHTQRLPQIFGLASKLLQSCAVKSPAAANLICSGISRGTGGSHRASGRL